MIYEKYIFGIENFNLLIFFNEDDLMSANYLPIVHLYEHSTSVCSKAVGAKPSGLCGCCNNKFFKFLFYMKMFSKLVSPLLP